MQTLRDKVSIVAPILTLRPESYAGSLMVRHTPAAARKAENTKASLANEEYGKLKLAKKGEELAKAGLLSEKEREEERSREIVKMHKENEEKRERKGLHWKDQK